MMMNKTLKYKGKSAEPSEAGSTWKFILLDADRNWRRWFSHTPCSICCSVEDLPEIIPHTAKDSLWILPGNDTADDLLRHLNQIGSGSRSLRGYIGSILLLNPPRPRSLPILHSWFDMVIGEILSFKFLPQDQLAQVLASPLDDRKDLFIGGVVDMECQSLGLVRGHLDRISVPLTLFQASGTTRPNFRRLELDDYGHTIRFGDYEAAADAILYEIDNGFRRRINAKRRGQEKGFGPSLRRLRLQRGLKRDSFPGIAVKTIARLERGEVKKPHGKTLQILAETLNVQSGDIESF